jgi:uncharacterized protein (TIGR02594 family)
MRFKVRLMLVAGCVTVLALSFPASGQPAPSHQPPSRPPLPALKPKHGVQQPAPAAAVRERPPVEHVSFSARTLKSVFGMPAIVAEARKYMGTNPTARTRLWCATFMNFVLAKLGYAGTNSDAARSFVYYGRRISEPQVGAIAVLTRGRNGGHVGVVSGIDANGNPVIISGNHNKRVGEAVYARSRVIAYVMPTERHSAPTMVAARGTAGVTPSDPGIDSPITELLAAIEAEQARAEKPRAPAPRQAAPAQAQRQAAPAQPQKPAEPYRLVQQSATAPQLAPQGRAVGNPFSELVETLERAKAPRGRVATVETGRGVR